MRFETFGFNLRYAMRQFGRNRVFAATVVLTIALGIGLNTAMFSVIRAVLLEPLGYRDPDRLVVMKGAATPVRFEEMLAGARSYAGLGAYAGGEESFGLSGAGSSQPEMLKGARVSGNFLEILGVGPELGRSFLPGEDKPGAAQVAMISARLWKRRFDGDARVLGRTVTLGGVATTIIGVLPAQFHFPFADADFWVTRPSEWSAMSALSRPISPTLQVFGRLKPGTDFADANAELRVLHRQYEAAHPVMLDAKAKSPDELRGMKEQLVADAGPKLWMLFGSVGLVLLIACANIASLLLARATARSREFALRAAVGAGRGRIVGQLLTESLLLALAGGALGVGLAELTVIGMRAMTAGPLHDLPRSANIGVDGLVLLFALGLSLLTGLLFGLAPALMASQADLAQVLRGSGEGASSSTARPVFLRLNARGLLVVGQVALSTVLLIGASLLVESLARVYRVYPGFEVSHLLTMDLALPAARYDSDQKRAAFYTQLVERLQALPGVKGAALTRSLPMTGYAATPIAVTGRAELRLNQRPFGVLQNVTPDYFQTLKIVLKRGREFTAHDDAAGTTVAVIDEGMARVLWPEYPAGEDPIGKHLLVGAHSKPTEIVGIVGPIKQQSLDTESAGAVYLSAAQQPPETAMLAIRTEGDPLGLANAVRGQILAIDRDQPVTEVASMAQVVDASEGELRGMMLLLEIFAGAATLIAVVGLYGVIAYSVAQRTKEIGIRRALGAQRGDILSLVLGQGLRMAVAGTVLGMGAAFAAMRLLRGMLFGVSASDPLTYGCVAALFVMAALAASYLPARRAAGIEPTLALRDE